jgi:acyl carrier protein
MNKNELELIVFEIVNSIASENSKTTVSKFNINLNLREDFGLDSMDLAELTVRIEDKFDIDIFEDGLVSTIQEIVDILSK